MGHPALGLTLMVPRLASISTQPISISPDIGFDSVTDLGITITGKNLRGVVTITVGGQDATNVVLAEDGLSATADLDVSAIAPGDKNVVVKTGSGTVTLVDGFEVLADQIETMIGDFTYLRNGNVVTTATALSGLINMAGGNADGQQDGIIADTLSVLESEACTAIYHMSPVAIPGDGDAAQFGLSNNAVVPDTDPAQNVIMIYMQRLPGNDLRIKTQTIVGGSPVTIASTVSPGGITPTHFKITKTTGNIYTTYFSQDDMATWTTHATGVDMSSVTDTFYIFQEGYGVNGSLDFSLTAVNLAVA